jgi:hypothetical protein
MRQHGFRSWPRRRWRRSCRTGCRRFHYNGRLGCARSWSSRGLRGSSSRLRRSRRRLGRLLADSTQHVARFRYLREIDLGLDAARVARCGRLRLRRLLVARAGKVLAHTLGEIGIERARVALLIIDADGRQIVYDRFALDFELARQIVDADLFQIGSQFSCFPVSREYSVPCTQYPALFKILYRYYQTTAIPAITSRLRAALRRARGLQTSMTHRPAARLPRRPRHQPRVPGRCRQVHERFPLSR